MSDEAEAVRLRHMIPGVRAVRTRTPGHDPSPNQTTLLRADRSADVTDIPWAEFLAHDFDWEQGEHVTIAAPTGWGKTTLSLAILPKRDYVIVLGTKPTDSTLDELKRGGYKVVRGLPLPPPEMHPRIIYWPRIERPSDVVAQRKALQAVLMEVYHRGGYTLVIDELDYVCNYLKLRPLVELIWRQGRSLGVSLVGGTQRPAFIPLLAYDQATHLFIGRDNDEVNTRRYASMLGASKRDQRELREVISSLSAYHFLYLNARAGREGFVTTKVSR